MPEFALECFEITTALLKAYNFLEFPFESNLLKALYLILSDLAFWCLSLLHLVVGVSHGTAPLPSMRDLPNTCG